ncbi:MAG: prepilin-type N-terminal cleavage/methylation domain-containing protein [Verrucomicrobiae bacterium]|nr:prepilin-type N-terminal cleavage/methylation domain-containing protein [Verrucomicrobiae bacterium]
MISGRIRQRRRRPTGRRACPRGFTVLELLVSMSILAVILLLLAEALEASLSQWTKNAGRSDLRGELRSTSEWMRRDLEAAMIERRANLPPLPDSVPVAAREFFEGKWCLPFEINRHTAKSGNGQSFANAEPGFDQLAFVIRTPSSLAGDPEIDQKRLGKIATDPSDDESKTADDTIQPCLVGYYVAYARDSPLATNSSAGLKLFRHFRPGGDSLGAGHSRGFVMAFSQLVNDRFDEISVGGARKLDEPNPAELRQGHFTNDRLPFLFSQHVKEIPSLELVNAGAPWPSNPPLAGSTPNLPSPPASYPPPEFTWDRWNDPTDPVHDYLFPDEAIAHNVVGFQCRAFRRVKNQAGNSVLMNATSLNAHLGLAGSEWPALAKPDFVEVTISVIPSEIAARLESKADWLGNGSAIARDLIENYRQTLQFHLAVGAAL